MEHILYFELAKEVEFAADESGASQPAYVKMSAFLVREPSPDESHTLACAYKKLIAKSLDVDENYVRSITEDEYFNNVDDEKKSAD